LTATRPWPARTARSRGVGGAALFGVARCVFVCCPRPGGGGLRPGSSLSLRPLLVTPTGWATNPNKPPSPQKRRQGQGGRPPGGVLRRQPQRPGMQGAACLSICRDWAGSGRALPPWPKVLQADPRLAWARRLTLLPPFRAIRRFSMSETLRAPCRADTLAGGVAAGARVYSAHVCGRTQSPATASYFFRYWGEEQLQARGTGAAQGSGEGSGISR
jgi:hypothetical protein